MIYDCKIIRVFNDVFNVLSGRVDASIIQVQFRLNVLGEIKYHGIKFTITLKAPRKLQDYHVISRKRRILLHKNKRQTVRYQKTVTKFRHYYWIPSFLNNWDSNKRRHNGGCRGTPTETLFSVYNFTYLDIFCQSAARKSATRPTNRWFVPKSFVDSKIIWDEKN